MPPELSFLCPLVLSVDFYKARVRKVTLQNLTILNILTFCKENLLYMGRSEESINSEHWLNLRHATALQVANEEGDLQGQKEEEM